VSPEILHNLHQDENSNVRSAVAEHPNFKAPTKLAASEEKMEEDQAKLEPLMKPVKTKKAEAGPSPKTLISNKPLHPSQVKDAGAEGFRVDAKPNQKIKQVTVRFAKSQKGYLSS
jgi:hypothetical protein